MEQQSFAQRALMFARSLKPRTLVAEAVQFAAFALATYGVYLIAGRGVAAIIGGFFVFLLATEVDR